MGDLVRAYISSMIGEVAELSTLFSTKVAAQSTIASHRTSLPRPSFELNLPLCEHYLTAEAYFLPFQYYDWQSRQGAGRLGFFVRHDSLDLSYSRRSSD